MIIKAPAGSDPRTARSRTLPQLLRDGHASIPCAGDAREEARRVGDLPWAEVRNA